MTDLQRGVIDLNDVDLENFDSQIEGMAHFEGNYNLPLDDEAGTSYDQDFDKFNNIQGFNFAELRDEVPVSQNEEQAENLSRQTPKITETDENDKVHS